MRYLILTLGIPGSGKTTWIKKTGLEKYAISPDIIRRLYYCPTYDIYGKAIQDLEHEDLVWKRMLNIIEDRMTRGEFIVVDATHFRYELINVYKPLVNKYNYTTYIIDLRKSLEQCLNNNRTRKYSLENIDNFVSEDRIKFMYDKICNIKIPSYTKLIKSDKLHDYLNIEQNFSRYNKINIIGDIHGNYEKLLNLYKKMDIDFNNRNELNIFIGDYFDRGNSIVETFNHLYSLIDNDNIIFLMGNHEMNLYRYRDFIEDRKIENIYRSITLEQSKETFKVFKENSIEVDKVEKFYRKLVDMLYFKYYDKYIFVNHGGFPNKPDPFVRSFDFWKGIGTYDDMIHIAKTWIKKTPQNYIEIHGHRDNEKIGPTIFKDRYYVLNGMSYDDNSIKGLTIHNNNIETFIV